MNRDREPKLISFSEVRKDRERKDYALLVLGAFDRFEKADRADRRDLKLDVERRAKDRL